MKVEVRFRGLESSEALRDHALERTQALMRRFGRELTGVVIRISDVNGPKGGVDKRCQITARGPRLGTASLEELSADVYSAVGLAIERIGQAVGRELDRARTLALRDGPARGSR